MKFFSSWLGTQSYSLCTDEEKTYIHNQIKDVIAASEQDILHLKIATKMLVSLKLSDETPVTLTVQEFATICVEQKFIRCPFIVSYGQSSILFSFIMGFDTDVMASPIVSNKDTIITANVSSTPLEVEYDTLTIE